MNVTAVNGTGPVGSQITLPSGALLTVNADGSFDFDPNGKFENLAVGATATETFTYTISDGFGGTDTATMTITINGVNDTPAINIALADQSSTDGNSSFSMPTSGNFSDPDGDTLTFSLGAGAPPWVSINPTTGVVTTTGAIPANASQQTNIGGGTPGTYDITVIASDPSAATAQDTFKLTIANLAPIAVNDTASVPEDGPAATGNVITDANTGDADTPPDSDPLQVTAATQGTNALTLSQPFTTSGGGVLTLNANGDYTFDPNTSYNGLDVGETATETITYTVDDGQGGTDTATLTITVNGANDAPVVVDPANPGVDPSNPLPGNPLTVIPTQPVTDGQDFTTTPLVDVATAFVDPDSEPLTFTTTNPLPTGLTLNPDGTITGTIDPSASQGGPNSDGMYPITVTATDPDGATATLTFTIDVSNPPPVATDDVAATLQATPITISVLDNDHDTPPDSDPISVIAASSPQGAVSINPDGSLTFSPNGGFFGTAVVTYTISDGNGGTATAQVSITVEPQDLLPRTPTPDIFDQIPPTDPNQTAPGLNANGAVLDAINGTLGGTGSFFSPALSIGGTDLSLNPVLASINMFRSLDGLPTLNRLQSLQGVVSLSQADGPVDVVVDHMRRTEQGSDGVGERTGGLWGADTISGFSLKYGEANGVHEAITIESIVRNSTLILNARPSDGFAGHEIESYELHAIGEGELPKWLKEIAPGVFMGERPAHDQELNLTVRAILKDGSTLSRDITIQTPTGEISDYKPGDRADVVPLFNEQLQARHELNGIEVQALAQALAG